MTIDADTYDPLTALRGQQTEEQQSTIRILEEIKSKYIRSPRDETLREEIERLFGRALMRRIADGPQDASNRPEGRSVVLVGDSGVGKTAALERAFRKHASVQGYGPTGNASPILSVTAPSPCTLKTLGHQILQQLGYPIARDLREHLLWERVRFMLAQNAVLLLHIDEAQHVVHAKNDNETQKISDTLKGLMQSREWPVSLVISGLPGLLPFIERDRQLSRRCSLVRFSNLTAKDNPLISKMVRGLAHTAQMPLGGELDVDLDLTPRLVHATGYALGRAIEMTQDAIEIGLRAADPALVREHFAVVYARRTGAAAQYNPFVVDEFAELDMSKPFATQGTDDHGVPDTSKSSSKQTKRPF